MTYEYHLEKPILQVKDLCVTFEGMKVLDHLSFTIHDVVRPGLNQGQIVALLGPSGVGKSVLFRRIAGLDKADSGEILIGLDAHPTQAGLVGVVMQNYPLVMHRTVESNLLVAGRQAGLATKAAESKAHELLDTFSLYDRRHAWPAQLSGGQRQRVAIAQQLMCSEHLLLMDEPFSGLDPVMKGKAREIVTHVASLHEENTIFIVEHDVRSALKVCDQVLVIGRDPKDPHAGAKIRADIDLKARGIAWRPDAESLPAYTETLHEIEAMFPSLS